MKLELLERLLDAGFSKDEIIQLTRGEPAAAAPDPAAAAPDPEGGNYNGTQIETGTEEQSGTPVESAHVNVGDAAEESGSKEQSAADKGTAFEKRLAGIEKTMADLTKAIQTGNLRNDSFPNPVESLEERTDHAMIEIIRPTRRERAL